METQYPPNVTNDFNHSTWTSIMPQDYQFLGVVNIYVYLWVEYFHQDMSKKKQVKVDQVKGERTILNGRYFREECIKFITNSAFIKIVPKRRYISTNRQLHLCAKSQYRLVSSLSIPFLPSYSENKQQGFIVLYTNRSFKDTTLTSFNDQRPHTLSYPGV